MKKMFIMLLVFATLCCHTTTAQTKVGVVSVDDVFVLMPETAKADSMLVIFQKELSQSYQDQQNEVNAAIEKFYKDSLKMTATLKDLKRKDLQDRISALSAQEQDLNKSLEAEKEKLLKPVREKLLKVIKDVAKENNYTHVAYKEQMIVFPEADDITGKVKTRLGIK